MSGPDQLRDQDSWQPPPEDVAPVGAGSDLAPGSTPVVDQPPADAPASADNDSTQVVSADELRQASGDAPLPPAPVSQAPVGATTVSSDPDATSVYQVPSESPGSSSAGPAAAGYAAGYSAGRYGPADPDAPRPYETPSYAPTSGPTPTSYSYQEPAYGYAPAPPVGEQSVLAPARTRVVIPKAPSRAGANALVALIGLLLTFGGIALLVLVPLPNDSMSTVLNMILVVLTIVIMTLPTLLLVWGSWATFVPGLLITGVAIWILMVPGATDQLRSAFGDHSWVFRLIVFFGPPLNDDQLPQAVQVGGIHGLGLALGLVLLFASIAAMMVRRYTRRAVQDAFDAEYASEQIRPMQRQ